MCCSKSRHIFPNNLLFWFRLSMLARQVAPPPLSWSRPLNPPFVPKLNWRGILLGSQNSFFLVRVPTESESLRNSCRNNASRSWFMQLNRTAG
ncbi:hypothetical protein BDW62DRAFT_155354 [Aspergillus aurantiobrunneus]